LTNGKQLIAVEGGDDNILLLASKAQQIIYIHTIEETNIYQTVEYLLLLSSSPIQ
jgi:sRNA-binding regulator protein Hfq